MRRMKKLGIFIIGTILLLVAVSCAGRKHAAPADTRYQRKPIVEVTERELALDSAQINATVQQLLGNSEKAIELYQSLLKKDAGYAPAHYELGRVFMSLGWLDSALVHTQQACKLNPKSIWYQKQLAQVYMMQRDDKNLTATWESIVRAHPDELDNYYSLSNAYLMADNANGAIEVLDRVEKRFGIIEEVSLQKQKLWSAINKPERARKELEKLAEAMPSEPRYNAILAESYMNEKNYSKALQYYHRIEETNPGDENINISLASCYLAMGDMVGTYRYLRRGLMNGNIDCQHRLMYLTEFLRNKNFFAAYSRQGFMLADTLAAQCQPDDGHCMIYGQMLAAQERYAEAAEQFLKHLSHDKSQYAVWEALLVCEGTLPDRKGELMEHALQAAELFPLHLRPYLILAQGYYDEGNCERARYYMDRCMMIAPNEAAVKRLDQQIKQKCQ